MPFVVDDPDAVAIVISPLNAIMKDQVKKLYDSGVPACFLDMTGKDGTTYKLKKTQHDQGKISCDVVLINTTHGRML
jgi:superfamily II DNA helicase RecQ